jgi:hypothetical protein
VLSHQPAWRENNKVRHSHTYERQAATCCSKLPVTLCTTTDFHAPVSYHTIASAVSQLQMIRPALPAATPLELAQHLI